MKDQNPYESPKTRRGVQTPAKTSWSRIPLAVICLLIAVLFVATLILYGSQIVSFGVSASFGSREGRLALVYFPLSIIGILAFGMIAIGLFRRQSKTAKVGLILFAIGTIVQIIVIAVLP